MADIILHHYLLSPYAEKIRLVLGLKGLAWRSVVIPVVMPKPDLVALTGGYRRTPVMQIGADVYCDTLCIARELERRFPEPTLYAGTDHGTAEALAWWAEKSTFNTAVGLAFGEMGEKNLPEGFLEDRGAASGREISAAKLRSARPILVDTLRAQFSLLDAMLEAKPHLLGDRPGIADFAAYHPAWFIEKNCDVRSSPLAEFPRVVEWMGRIQAIGHGRPAPMTSTEALEVARAATPSAAPEADPRDPAGRRPGQRVRVTPDDFARVPVTGELVRSDANEIVIRRADERAADVLVHFPRAGFVVSPAKD